MVHSLTDYMLGNVCGLWITCCRLVYLCKVFCVPYKLCIALLQWHPEIRTHCDTTPVILCGCQNDLRNDIETISSLAKQRRIPVTSEQVMCQHWCVTYWLTVVFMYSSLLHLLLLLFRLDSML